MKTIWKDRGEQQGDNFVEVILNNREIGDKKNFLNPSLDNLHSPFKLKDMKKTVNRIKKAIENQEQITIFGDYDVDGISSTSLLLKVFESLNANVNHYIPNRLKEGYGLNKEAIKDLSENTDLLITVDCGIKAHEEIKLANDLGLEVIVTDHHTIGDSLPNALSVINPKRGDYPFKELAGVGVAFKLAQGVLNPDSVQEMRQYLDLIALGTIADVVPLIDENRIIVKEGMKIINNNEFDNFNIQRLKEEKYKGKNITAGGIGYNVAPIINACGRMGQADKGVNFFTTEKNGIKQMVAKKIISLNEERKEISKRQFKVAERLIEKNDLKDDKVLIIPLHKAQTGVIGITAGDIKEKYNKPVIVLSIDEEGIATGSGRSISAFNLYEALKECEGLLEGYGGHKLAGGLGIKEENIDKFRKEINKLADKELTEKDLIPKIKVDTELSFEDLNKNTINRLENLRPFGMGNPTPVFKIEGLTLQNFNTIGRENQGLKLQFVKDDKTVEAIAWDSDLRNELLGRKYGIDTVFNLKEYNNKAQLTIKDIKLPEYNNFVEELFAKKDMYDDFYNGIESQNNFNTKVVGVTFEGRSEIIKKYAEKDMKIELIREPNNKYDPNAIGVHIDTKEDKKQIGYINSDLAYRLAPNLDSGIEYNAFITNITGGEEGKRNLGVNIYLEKNGVEDKHAISKEAKATRKRLAQSDNKRVKEEIKEVLIGNYDFRAKQKESIARLEKNINTLSIFGTGRGKSAVFQTIASLRAIKKEETTVLVYPLNSLINDQYNSLKEKLSQLGLKVYRGVGIDKDNSSMIKERRNLNKAIDDGEVDLLLTTPEFLYYHIDKIQKLNVGFLVADEVHNMASSSKSFRETYTKLDKLKKKLDNPLTMGATATADSETARMVIDKLDIKPKNIIIDETVRHNLNLIDERGMNKKEKFDYVNKILKTGEKTIVYIHSREKSMMYAKELSLMNKEYKNQVAFYHSGMNKAEKEEIEKLFKAGEIKMVFSTSSLGEGVNMSNIRHIIHWHLPFDYISYNQKSGRGGRNGKEAYIHLLYNKQNVSTNEFILNNICPDKPLLRELYRVLKTFQNDKGIIKEDNLRLKDNVNTEFNDNNLSEGGVEAGLKMFEELSLIEIEENPNREIKLIAQDKKSKIEDSIRYQEGMQDKRAFKEFKEFALNDDKDQLLSSVNRPIYPTESL